MVNSLLRCNSTRIAFLIISLFTVRYSISYGQIPTSCFEIEGILVDACGNPEGENEMIRFRVGSNPLNVNSLSVNFPNNTWLGVCQNTTTATKVSQLNSSILNCGLLREPSGGILPAGAQVILVTSTNFQASANSFAGLSDTVYIIFQCAGNTAGHFANASTSGTRTLGMSFGSTCSDQVSYQLNLLTDQNGIPGPGGNSALRDGASVVYSWAGLASYINTGCVAPFPPQVLDAGVSVTACPGDTIVLNATASPNFSTFSWSGGNGTFINGNSKNARYVVSPSDVGTITLSINATKCNGSASDNMQVTVNNTPPVSITPNTNLTLCPGTPLTLTATGTAPFSWTGGSTGTTLTITNPGTYICTGGSGCATDKDTVIVQPGIPPAVTITANGPTQFCAGQSVVLSATGATTYSWSNGSTGAQITVTTGGNYIVTGTTNCGNAYDTLLVTLLPSPSLNLSPSNPAICPNSSATLIATGNGSIQWVGQPLGASNYTVNTPGVYSASSTTTCGTIWDSVTVTAQVPPVANLAHGIDTLLCPNEQITLVASGNGTITWNTGSNAAALNVTAGGTYYVVVSNSCGTDTAFQTILSSNVDASFTASEIFGNIPLEVNFTNNSTNADAFFWNWGNDSITQDVNPSIVYTAAGSYPVILTAINGDGCKDTAYVVIVVNPEADFTVYIPSAFTPDGDGINDVFRVQGIGIMRFSAQIFNRWGEEIYQWNDVNQGWDGRVAVDEKAMMGVYAYRVTLQNFLGQEYVYSGQIKVLK